MPALTTRRADLRTAIALLMEPQRLDALVYPARSNPPRLIGDLNMPHGANSRLLAPSTGYPAITVPMGYTRGGALAAGLSFFGRAHDEARRIGYVYGYDQPSHQVRPPLLTVSRLTSTPTTGEGVRASASHEATRALEVAG